MNAISKKTLSLLVVVAMVLVMSPVITLPVAAEENPLAAVNAWVSETKAQFAAGGDVVAQCPVCKEEVTWKPISGEQTEQDFMYPVGEEVGETTKIHVYLSGNLEYKGESVILTPDYNGSKTCIYLNDKTWTTDVGFQPRGTTSFIGGENGKITRPASSTSTTRMFPNRSSTKAVNFFGGTYENLNSADMFFLDYSSRNFNLYGGTFKAVKNIVHAPSNGGNATVYINGSEFIATGGPAISLNRQASVVMNSGSITYAGEAPISGDSGLVLLNKATANFTMNGGKICGGEATGKGGNVYVISGTFTMNDGEIYGGDVYAEDTGYINMAGGEIYCGNVVATNLTNTGGEIIDDGAVVVKASGMTGYKTVAAAVAAYTGAGYIKLFNDAAMTLSAGNYYVDINGNALTASGAGKLYVLDSANDDYVGGGTVTATGVDVQKAAINPVNGNQYITLDGAAHRIEMALTDVSFRPGAAGLYYKASYKCDATLAAKITAYGVALDKDEMPGADFTVGSELTGFAAAQQDLVVEGTSAGVYNILNGGLDAAANKARGEAKIYANAYVKIGELVVLGDNDNVGQAQGQAWSLQGVVEYINTNWETYKTHEAAEAIKAFAGKWAGLGWNLGNISANA